MNVKAQVTIFVILAIVIIAAGGIAYYMEKNIGTSDAKFSTNLEIQAKYDKITAQVYDCLESTCQDALDVVGLQGGYYEKPADSYDFGWGFIPYYYNEGKFAMPTTSEMQKQLGLAVDENIPYCIEDIDKGDFNLTYLAPKTKAEIKAEEVTFKTDFQITVSDRQHASKFQLKNHPANIPSKIYDMIQISDFIYQSHKEDPYMISFSTLVDMGTEKNLFIDLTDFDKDSTLFVITYNNTDKFPKTFEFLAKYKERTVPELISPDL